MLQMPPNLAYSCFQEVDRRLFCLIEEGEFQQEIAKMSLGIDVQDHVIYANELVKTFNYLLAFLQQHPDYYRRISGTTFRNDKFVMPPEWQVMNGN